MPTVDLATISFVVINENHDCCMNIGNAWCCRFSQPNGRLIIHRFRQIRLGPFEK